ncbi:chorismate-binding protein [Duganella sp. Leaf126]|uniref:chorismate-binding protein n=1 Tax=Duganella sp. Leaf126 TaxID=1736266 RepID=UPI000A965866
MTAECFALLDDASPPPDARPAGASAAARAPLDATEGANLGAINDATSRLYTDHVATLSCNAIGEWPQMLDAMQAALARGQYAVTLCSYELGVQLLGIGATACAAAMPPDVATTPTDRPAAAGSASVIATGAASSNATNGVAFNVSRTAGGSAADDASSTAIDGASGNGGSSASGSTTGDASSIATDGASGNGGSSASGSAAGNASNTALADACAAVQPTPASAPAPLAQVLLFRRCDRLTAAEVGDWLAARALHGARPAGIANVRPSIDQPAFDAALARIHAYIEAGDTYQVNYTMRLRFDAFGGICALYARLRARQPVPYGALVQLADGSAVLSLSPELFVRHARGVLTARPMKGTAPATREAADDAERARALAADPKNRAENLMIVDLLRNDIARVAVTGSVQVPALFDVQRYGSVLQMTSTITATLRADATLAQVFEALYPCGSITGAPKRRAMEIINELEPDPRGIYTGAIGWFDPAAGGSGGPDDTGGTGSTIGDFCLSVPIRTLALGAPDAATGVARGEMGVGAGIVYDSASGDEYDECRLKARFLTGLMNSFEIFETMHVTPADGVRHRARHLQRMATSAAYFGFAWDAKAANACLDAVCTTLAEQAREAAATGQAAGTAGSAAADGLAGAAADLPGDDRQRGPAFRLRLALAQSGAFTVQHAPLAPLQAPLRLLLADDVMDAGDLFLRHKTSIRSRYDDAWRDAEAQGAFDTLFFNARGELTEGGRSNVFVKLDGRWLTPALQCGVLPGVMRSVLLDDPAWQASEAVITRAMLARAEALVVCNALRGAVRATL